MINLYIFNESSSAAVYGIGTYIHELALAIKLVKINVCVIHLRTYNPDAELSESGGIRHCFISSPIHQNNLLEWDRQEELYYRNVVYLLQLQIKDTNSLIFHLNYNQSTKLAGRLKEVFDCKIITAVHYLNWCFSLSGNITRFRNLLAQMDNSSELSIQKEYLKEKELFGLSDKIICLSEVTRKIIHNDYEKELSTISVIYNGLKDVKEKASEKTLRKKYGIPLNVPILLFVGRLDAIKGLNYVISAFNEVLIQYPKSHLVIAGNGSYDTYLKECANNWMQIHFTGLLSKESLYELYSVADIGLMPSFHEQCSYVAIEMMMHGIPIISSTTTGLKEMVEDGITGLHIPIKECSDKVELDSRELVQKILYLLQHPKDRKRMGKNARKRYETVYSADIFRKNMINLYQSM